MNFANSKFYKWLMPYLYGWGASLVIAGALFKILHWQFANEMLIVGMGTEALIFFMSARDLSGSPGLFGILTVLPPISFAIVLIEISC